MVEIDSIKWGEVVIDGVKYKDAVISDKSVYDWDWRNDGTRHNPGITVKAVEQIINNDVIILTMVFDRKLRITNETLCKINGKIVHIIPTDQFYEVYKSISENWCFNS